MHLRELSVRVVAAVVWVTMPWVAMAESSGPDWTQLTSAIDFGELATGLLPAGAALIGVYLVIKGVRIIVGLVRGGDDPYDGSGASGLDFRDLYESTPPDEYDPSRNQVQSPIDGGWRNSESSAPDEWYQDKWDEIPDEYK